MYCSSKFLEPTTNVLPALAESFVMSLEPLDPDDGEEPLEDEEPDDEDSSSLPHAPTVNATTRMASSVLSARIFLGTVYVSVLTGL